MTPATFKAIRQRAGMTQREVCAFLRLADNDGKYIRDIEAGRRTPSGPVVKLMELLNAGVIGPVAEQE